MLLEDETLPPFEPILNRLYDLALRNGFAALEKQGYSYADFKGNPSVRRKFIQGCHYGYDLAQRQIAGLVIEMEKDVRRLTEELKEHRRRKDHVQAKVVLNHIQVIKNRQITLRRLVDSILFAIIEQENWLIRRFTIDLQIHNIDPDVLNRTVQIAVDRNREDRMKFNLVSDLSTVVQIGDLVEIDVTSERSRKWRVIELKEGRVNETLAGLIEQEKRKTGVSLTEELKSTLPEKGVKQALRMAKQVHRMEELERIVETDRGMDPLIETETIMTPDTVALDSFEQEIEQVYREAKEKGAGALEISGCLRIVGIRSDKAKNQGRAIAEHRFFHMGNRKSPCAFSGKPSEAAREEERRRLKAIPYFVNLTDYNLNVPIADPIFLWNNRKMVFDLVMGRVQIFVQFDFEAFFRLAESHGIKITWITGKQAEEIKKFSMRLPRTDDAWGVLVVLPNGDRLTLLAGFLGRPFTNCTPPKQLIEMIKGWPEQIAKSDPDKTLESPI
jgi:hypothetical protein